MVVDHQTDLNRKKIDYLIERWQKDSHRKCNIQKLKGTVVHFTDEDDSNVDEFLDDIYSRLGKNSVLVFSGQDYAPPDMENVEYLSYVSSKSVDYEIEQIPENITMLTGAKYERTRSGHIKCYVVYTKKGKADIEVSIRDDERTTIDIAVKGYGDVVRLITQRIEKGFARSPRLNKLN